MDIGSGSVYIHNQFIRLDLSHHLILITGIVALFTDQLIRLQVSKFAGLAQIETTRFHLSMFDSQYAAQKISVHIFG